MTNFNDFINLFFNSEYFVLFLVIIMFILLVVIVYLIKIQLSLRNEMGNVIKNNNVMLNEVNEDILEAEVINSINEINKETEISEPIKETSTTEINKLKNPILEYEENEEENAIISTKELANIEAERDTLYGKDTSAKLIEEYELEQETKAIISYEELLNNSKGLELNYKDTTPSINDDAPIIKQVEIKQSPLKGVSYAAEAEYLKILKEFRTSLIE